MVSLLRLIVAWATLFLIGTDLFVVSPLIPLIADDYQVGIRGAGLAVTAFAAGYVVAAPIFGHLADRLGRRLVLTCCLVAFAAANFLTAAAFHLPMLMAARLLCGIAAAGVTPSVYALIGSAAPPGRRGTWISIVLTGLLLSLPLGAPIGAMASLELGWPAAFLFLAACSLLLAPVHRVLWPGSRQAVDRRADCVDGVSPIGMAQQLLPTVAWSTALYEMYTYLGAGMAELGYGPGAIAEIVGIYGAAAFAGALLGGRIADRRGPAAAIRVSLAGMAVCFALLRFALLHGVLAEAAFAATSLLAQIFFPAQQMRLMAAFPARNATVLAWNNSALFLGMALGSLIGGQAMALGGFTAILPVSAVIAIAGWASFSRYLPRMATPRTT
jgi:predicted MFS family arabinose efflux permease